MRQFLRAVKERGTILGLINYGDRIVLRGDMGALDWAKLAVTYCVATYGAARYAARPGNGRRNKHTHSE